MSYRRLDPPHPGRFVRLELVEPSGLGVARVAEGLGISRQALSALLNGRASPTADLALRLEKAFGVDADTLVRMQAGCDVAQARRRPAVGKVRKLVPRRRAA